MVIMGLVSNRLTIPEAHGELIPADMACQSYLFIYWGPSRSFSYLSYRANTYYN